MDEICFQGKQEESSGRGQDPLAERSRQVHKCVAEKETLEVHNWLMSTGLIFHQTPTKYFCFK